MHTMSLKLKKAIRPARIAKRAERRSRDFGKSGRRGSEHIRAKIERLQIMSRSEKSFGFFDAQTQFHAVSLSGGKDSTAMLLLMIQRGMPIDAVLNADTGMEFPEMVEHLARVDAYLFRERGLHITTLRHPKGFEYLMFDEPKQKENSIAQRMQMGISLCGNGWPGFRARWCTGLLKTQLINKEANRLKGKKQALHYIGIAADEAKRCKAGRYPLVEWGVTETQALQICYDNGFDFGGLYRMYRRASCWCCPLQRIDELRKLRKHHPDLWEKLREMDDRARRQFAAVPWGQFKENWSVKKLEERFAWEESGGRIRRRRQQ